MIPFLSICKLLIGIELIRNQEGDMEENLLIVASVAALEVNLSRNLIATAGNQGLIRFVRLPEIDIMTYVFAGLSLSAILSMASHAQYTFMGYLAAVYIAYIPTQLPIAVGEMFATGFILSYIFKQRPDVLRSLKVIAGISALLFIPTFLVLFPSAPVFAEETSTRTATLQEEPGESHEEGMAGMDEAVNEKLAEDAGKAPRDPYINLEALGDVWNTVMLLGGAICGFIIGRWWHILFDRKENGQVSESR